ncbi:MAG: hypothetical protein C4576_28275 [Desulfobacteraceae bacterium]|nr:MAG: hypothetical protein C4576_28275 [Desulfobacteraceae bacterium]
MILHPAIVALLFASVLVTLMVLFASSFGWKIIRYWDIASGSERQLALERSTYLVSTLLACAFAFQIGSLFLYVYTADDLHTRFVGAMCAAGSLNVNRYGYPGLFLKILNCILAGLWLIMNHADSRAHDYPLIRKKFILLILIAPFAAAETAVQTMYFAELRPDVITSCCGSLFSSNQKTIPGELISLPKAPVALAFYASLILLFAAGFRYWWKGQGGRLFSLSSVITFAVFALALVSFISLYFYELPTHHCPFCILQGEYGHIGYLFYGTLIGGVVCGAGVGLLEPFGRIGSLGRIVPLINRKLSAVSIGCYLLFAAVSIWKILTADLTLDFAYVAFAF